MDRIEDLTITQDRFAPRQGLPDDEDEWFDDVAQQLELELAPSAQWVSEYYPVIERTEQDGHICVTFPVASQQWATALLLRLGSEVLRVGDEPLARAAAEDAVAALAHYDETPG